MSSTDKSAETMPPAPNLRWGMTLAETFDLGLDGLLSIVRRSEEESMADDKTNTDRISKHD